MSKTKIIPSTKKLSSTKTLKFIKREFVIPFWNEWRYDLTEIHDYYLHEETGITVVRELYRYPNHKDYVKWTCDELGGGHAHLECWIYLARKTPKRRHSKSE
jgi:hypothetical protein